MEKLHESLQPTTIPWWRHAACRRRRSAPLAYLRPRRPAWGWSPTSGGCPHPPISKRRPGTVTIRRRSSGTVVTPASQEACDTSGTAEGVFVSGDVAYIADGSHGLATVDVSDPASPALLTRHDTAGDAWDVAVSGRVAYVADGVAGLVAFDVSDPTGPIFLDSFDTSGTAQGLCIAGDVVFVADGDKGLSAIDVSSPRSLALLDCMIPRAKRRTSRSRAMWPMSPTQDNWCRSM